MKFILPFVLLLTGCVAYPSYHPYQQPYQYRQPVIQYGPGYYGAPPVIFNGGGNWGHHEWNEHHGGWGGPHGWGDRR